MKTGPKPRDLKIRFWEKVEVKGKDDCWIWKAAISNIGRGVMRVNRKTVVAQRIAWVLEKGNIPKGYDVLNTCKNDLCVNPSHLFLGTHKDRDCGAVKRPLKDRFWEKADIKGNGRCWEWKAGRHSKTGYAMFYDSNKVCTNASRTAWKLTFGNIPEGMFVCHHCDNPGCVNPHHLFLGIHTDNMRDKKFKGRQNNLKGEKHPNHVLTEEQVREIKSKKLEFGDCAEFARRFNVSKSAISLIIKGKNWKGGMTYGKNYR